VPVLVLAALGSRAGLLPTAALVPAIALGFMLALLAVGIAAYALTDIWNNGAEGARTAVAGIVYALPALVLLGTIAGAAILYPRLTDIATDPENPPAFVASADATGDLENREVEVQKDAYPDIVTHNYPLPLGEVYAGVRAVVDERGWTVVAESQPATMPAGRSSAAASPQIGETDELARALARKSVITQSRSSLGEQRPETASEAVVPTSRSADVATVEAVASTPLFGFRDAVIVRMRAAPDGTDVDMRSTSGIGEHDLGQNARRIRAFFARLDAVLQPPSTPGVASAGQ
jgi:hypothetical protein